jgi:hypothetical protein
MGAMIDKARTPAPGSVTVHLSRQHPASAGVSAVGRGVLVGPDLVLVPHPILAALRRQPTATVLVAIHSPDGPGGAGGAVEWHTVTTVEPLTFEGDPDGARAAGLLRLDAPSRYRPTVVEGQDVALDRAWSAGRDTWDALVASGAVPAPTDAGGTAPAAAAGPAPKATAPRQLAVRVLATATLGSPKGWCKIFPWLC